MNNHHRHDPRLRGNMGPHQSGSPDHHDPRSQQRISDRSGSMNAQQSSPTPQSFDASSWVNPAYAAQYYGYNQTAPENPYSGGSSFMPPHQNMQSFPPVSFDGSFGNPSYQSQFDPRAQMLQNWTMAQSAYGAGMQFAGQQYPVQHVPYQQTAYHQTSPQQVHSQPQTDIKQDPEAVDMYSGGYDDSRDPYSGNYNSPHDAYSGDHAAEDDPSAQLMQELVQNILDSKTVSPVSGTSDSNHEDVNKGSSNFTVDAAGYSSSKSMAYKPQNSQSAENQTFRSFEHESPVSESGQSQRDELDQQVSQVLAGLNDEGHIDVFADEQAFVQHTPRTLQRYSHSVADGERQYSAPNDTNEEFEQLFPVRVESLSDIDDQNANEEDVMQDEEHAAADNQDEGEVSDNDSEQEDSDEDAMEVDTANEEDVDISDEDMMEDDAAEEDDVDVDVSDVEVPSDQDAHDSGVDASRKVEFEGYMLEESPLKTIKKTISKEDKELHHKAWKLQPHHLPAHRYWMAILMHTVQPSKAKVEKDFVWLKGSRINTVETMWNKYREVTTEEQHQILFCGRVPQFTDTVEALDTFGDKLIVFRAAKKEVIVVD